MTLILTLIARGGVLQVSDRLVTVNGAEHDPRANKTVVARTRDGVFTFSYSGAAYIGSVPTDEWLASTIWGPGFPGGHLIATGKRKSFLDIGQTTHAIRDGLTIAYRSMRGSKPYAYVAAAGVRLLDPHFRTAGYEINNYVYGDRITFEVFTAHIPRHLRKGQFVLIENPGVLNADEREQLRLRLKDTVTIDQMEGAMVACVRRVSMRTPLVGSDCMSVVLAHALEPNLRVRYIPEAPETAVIGQGVLERFVPIGYSPYILGSASAHSPQVMVGSYLLTLGDIDVSLEGPDPGTPEGGLTNQQRPPKPR